MHFAGRLPLSCFIGGYTVIIIRHPIYTNSGSRPYIKFCYQALFDWPKFLGNGHDASGGTKNGSTSSSLPSFQEILDYVKISRESLNEPCSEEHILEIAKKVTDWEVYAPYLGLSDADIESLKIDNSKTPTRSLRAFKLWEERAAFKATYLHLAENVFFKYGNAKMATLVCKLAKQQS